MKRHSVSSRYFIILNIAGIICGVAGIIYILYFNRNHSDKLAQSDMTLLLAMLSPVIIIILLWLTVFLKIRKQALFDEKIFNDINKSGMTVFIISLFLAAGTIIKVFSEKPVVSPIYINGRMDIIWMMLYLFIAILIFSVTALYNFKRN
jgi:hypothetical protein